MTQVVLLADDNEEFREVWGKTLANAEYEVILAANPLEARKILRDGGIDLAILDVRLESEDELDISGLNLATDITFRHIPKIIVTGYKPSPEDIRKLRELSADELPSAVTWMGKEEGVNKLLELIPQVIDLWPQLQQVQILANKISKRLETDQAVIRRHANHNYIMSVIFSLVGFLLIAFSIILALFSDLDISVAVAVSGIITEVLGYLFFRRLDTANVRMDNYHRELLQTHWLELLLATCEPLPSKNQIITSEYIIKTATDSWFSTQSTT